VENRITNHLDEYFQAIDDKLRVALGEYYHTLPNDKREGLRDIFVHAVHDVIAMAKKGKNIHERFVQNVVLNAVDPIVGLDVDQRIFFWNRGAEEVFGYPREEILGKPLTALLECDADCTEDLRVLDEAFHRDGSVRDFHTRALTRDERIILVSLSRTMLRDEFEQQMGSLAIIRDMTAMKQLERQVAHNEKLALLGQIAAGIAHEIGTPLNIISGIAECFLLDRDAMHPEREDLETIISQTDRITKLVRDLLSFARPQPMRADRIHLSDEIARAVSLLRGRFDKHGVTVQLELDEVPDVVADPNQLQQVFLNLLVNACDAFADNVSVADAQRTITITTHMRCSEQGDLVHIHFIDNGPGMTADLRARVFEPFVTTKEVGRGTGLGLAVCRRIIENHHGVIEVVSEPGRGADFAIRFPVDVTAERA
jgi:PAS domain S-box-containing protein